MPDPQSKRVGTLVWAMAAIVLVAVVALWLVLSADPDPIGSRNPIAVPADPQPTPLMTPTQEPAP